MAGVFDQQRGVDVVDFPLHILEVDAHSRFYLCQAGAKGVIMLEHDGMLEVGFVGFHSVYQMVNQTRQRTGWSWVVVLKLILGSRSAALRVLVAFKAQSPWVRLQSPRPEHSVGGSLFLWLACESRGIAARLA